MTSRRDLRAAERAAEPGSAEPLGAEAPLETDADAAPGSGADARPRTRRRAFADAVARVEDRLAQPRIRRRLEIGIPVAILTVAAVARLTALGHPHLLSFDETYYVKEGWSMYRLGYEGEWAEGADERFAAGDPGALTDEPDYVVHPPLGKWIIGLAMAVVGMGDPFWWRLPVALAGVVLVGLTYAIARGLLGSLAFATFAGTALAVDGLGIVMSRTSLLDTVLAVFAVAGAGAMLLDRRGSPARTVRALAAAPGRFGAAMWRRPWLVAAGALLGAACATKWSGLLFLAAFGLWSVLMDALDRRRAGFRHPWAGTLLTQAPASFLLVVGPAAVVYLASWAGWFGGGWGSQHMLEHAEDRWTGALAWVPLGLQSLVRYHQQQAGFHVGLTNGHSYESPAIEWLWLGRPTAFEMEHVDGGTWWITALPNPVLWYASVLAIAFLIFHLGRTLDRRAAFLLVGFLAGYAVWLAFPERTIFHFYAIVIWPFMLIGLALALQQLVGPRAGADAPTRVAAAVAERRAAGWAAVAAIVLVALAALVWFFPVWYGIPLPDPQIGWRHWPPSG